MFECGVCVCVFIASSLGPFRHFTLKNGMAWKMKITCKIALPLTTCNHKCISIGRQLRSPGNIEKPEWAWGRDYLHV